MESKKIISALAIAAALVGCSQEEIATVENTQIASGSLTERPLLGNVTLNTGVKSRMAIKDGSAFNVGYETGDQVGACIIDEPDFEAQTKGTGYDSWGNTLSDLQWGYSDYIAQEPRKSDDGKWYTPAEAGVDPSVFYSFVPYISTNYPYTRDEDGAFQTQANLVEGNYMFYMPYQEKHLNRTPIDVVLPQIQDCSDDIMIAATKGGKKVSSSSTVMQQFYKGTMEGFEKVPALVGYKFLAMPTDGTIIEPTVQMNHIFSYPLITIENNFNGLIYDAQNKSTTEAPISATMTVDSIQVYYAGSEANPLFYTAPVSSKDIASTLAVDDEWNGKKFLSAAPTADILGETTTYAEHVRVTTDEAKLSVAETALNDVGDGFRNHVTMVLGKELKNGESYSFHAILPAGNYGNDLKARVYVTIGEKRYVITDATSTMAYKEMEGQDEPVYVGYYTADEVVADYAFVDEVHGGEPCVLVRGEQHPAAEVVVETDGTASAFKAFAGDMMTISLASRINAETGTVTGATAFALKEVDDTVPSDNGIMTNEDLIAYLNSYVQRGVALIEQEELRGVEKENWASYSSAELVANAGNIALAGNTNVVIDSTLVAGLYKQANGHNNEVILTLNVSSLPIANDVKIANELDGVYTFTSLNNYVSVKVKFNVSFNTNGKKLVGGINKISGTVSELKVNSNSVSNAVVMLQSGAEVTYKGAEGISAIYVPVGATLNVNKDCEAMIIAEGTVNVDAALTNDNNVFTTATVTNNSGKQIAGALENTVVSATFAEWPETAIPANSRINKVIINPAVEYSLALEQTKVAVLAGLSDVDVVLNAYVTGITSQNSVTLTNMKSMTSNTENGISWTTKNTSGIRINGLYNGVDYTTLNKITLGLGVSGKNVTSNVVNFADNQDGTYTINNLAGLQEFAASVADGNTYSERTVTLASDMNLAGITWNPISGFKGTFNGNGKTISNVSVKTADELSAGFFADLSGGTVKSLTLKNVAIEGQYKAGGIVGDGLCAKIENCTVDGGYITSTPHLMADGETYDDGNNAGGIVGYLSAEPNAYVKGCTVNGLTITAYRDLGGIVGTATGYGAESEVSSCNASNVTLIVDQSLPGNYKGAPEEANAGKFVGRSLYLTESGNKDYNVNIVE